MPFALSCRSTLVALVALLAPALYAQTAPAWTVNPEWVRAHEQFLASDAMGGRGSASRAEQITAEYVASEFIGYGLTPAPGMDGYIQSAYVEVYTTPKGRQRLRLSDKPTDRQTFNAIGYLQGTDPSGGTILLTAHLDHLGTAASGTGDLIYNGANDDASGTTAVLELAHALASGPKPRRSVLFVCYGSEEAGEIGSTYFGEHPPVPLKDLVANLEFEMIGNQDPKMPQKRPSAHRLGPFQPRPHAQGPRRSPWSRSLPRAALL